MKNIIFIVQQLSQPRSIKRIQNFLDAGYNCKVYGFNNKLYEENLLKSGLKTNEIWPIKKDDKRIKKFINYYKLIKHVLSLTKEDDHIYVFGFEIGLIISFLYRGNFIYEEADISASRISQPLFRAFLIFLDKRIIKRSCLTIFTSEAFQDYLFPHKNPYGNKIIFLKNKLHKSFKLKSRIENKKIDIHQIDFGFIGLIRYPNTILRFAKIIGKYFPQHQFHFYGESEGNFFKSFDWSNFNNIHFHGSFRNPDDLINIYSNIDINICCYDPNSINATIAEPNKLYESIFFNKPLIVSLGTYLQKRVESLGVGFSINALSDEEIFNFLNKLKIEDIQRCKIKCSRVLSSELINDPENDIKLIKDYLKC